MKIIYGPNPKGRMSYDLAFLYCLTLDHDGHKDWQLPNNSINFSKQVGVPKTPFWIHDEKEDGDHIWFCQPARYEDDGI